VLVLAAVAVGCGARAAGAADETPAPRTLALKVVDRATGEPIKGAAVKAQVDRKSTDAATDAEGRLGVQLAAAPNFVMISVKADGYVPLQVTWRREGSAIKVPDEYTLKLERGTTIGGPIRDEQGKPVAGATVYLLVPGQNRQGEPRVNFWDYPVKTDDQGRWRCGLMPADLDDLWIRLAHPDYVSDNSYGETPRPTIPDLRKGTGVMVMKRGLAVEGRVIDADTGRPIQGANVAQGRDRFGSHYPEATTDADGRFAFKNARPGETVLTVRAKGRAPDLKTVTPGPGAAPVEFRLGPGRTVRGRLVDQQGRPVAGAFVAADTWRGCRSLMWRVDTDAEGRFRWDEAPPDEVLIDMGKQGFQSVRHKPITPSDDEYTFTMPGPLRIKGTVVDASTGKPVPEFTVISGIDWGNGQRPHWERDSARRMTEGSYELTFTEPYPRRLVRVEAPGYKPAVSPAIKSDAGDTTFDARLEKGRDAAGVVWQADGTPLEGADVVLVDAKQPPFIQDGRAPDLRNNLVEKTDAFGRFSFPPQDGPFGILVLHDKGFARTDLAGLEKNEAVVVQPWGRVEGTVLVGGKPGAGAQLMLNASPRQPSGMPLMNFMSNATADDKGRFAFDRVPPGEATVARGVRVNDRMTTYVNSTPVDVEAGQTARVQVGGTGRPVVGRVTANGGAAVGVSFPPHANHIRAKVKPPVLPEGLNPEQRAEWMRVWGQTVEGKAYRRAASLHFPVMVEPDGSFRAEEVPAGTYTLMIQAHPPGAGQQVPFGEPLATATREFDVPEIPGGRSDEPLDIGTVDLKWKPK
jgi:protocatechuate 3,4-dioxygenase beta subunit